MRIDESAKKMEALKLLGVKARQIASRQKKSADSRTTLPIIEYIGKQLKTRKRKVISLTWVRRIAREKLAQDAWQA